LIAEKTFLRRVVRCGGVSIGSEDTAKHTATNSGTCFACCEGGCGVAVVLSTSLPSAAEEQKTEKTEKLADGV